MDDSAPWIALYLEISWESDVEPALVTTRVGLTPDTTSRIGEHRVSPSGHRYPTPSKLSTWGAKVVGPVRTYDLAAVVQEFTTIVAPHADAIAEAVRDLGLRCQLSIVMHMTEPVSSGGIDADAIALLHRLGASLDLDLYMVDEGYVPLELRP